MLISLSLIITTSDIERLMKRSAFDKRVFQDGIYIIEKCGVPLKWTDS